MDQRGARKTKKYATDCLGRLNCGGTFQRGLVAVHLHSEDLLGQSQGQGTSQRCPENTSPDQSQDLERGSEDKERDRLGTITKLGAALPERASARQERFELQAVARAVIPYERVAGCMRALVPGAPGVAVYYSPTKKRGRLGNLSVCGMVWQCPVCAAKISARRRQELGKGINAHRRRPLSRVLLATYTCAHHRGMWLEDLMWKLLRAQKQMVGAWAYRALMDRYGVVGTVKALEVTWSAEDGWHPHFHALMFLEGDAPDMEELRADLFAAWRGSAANAGLGMSRARGVDLREADDEIDDYVAKFGHERRVPYWGASAELTQWHRKHGKRAADGSMHLTPFDLLRAVRDAGELEPGQVFRTYVEGFKGRSQLRWSRGLRASLGLGRVEADEELAEDIARDDILLALLSREEWAAVRHFHQEARIEELAGYGDADALMRWVSTLVDFKSRGATAWPPIGGEAPKT